MSESEVEKISEIVEDLEALKKAKERYQAKWPDFPLSGDPDPLGNPYWSENVEPLVNKILIDLVDLEDCISSHWPYSWPDWPPRNAIIDIIKEQRKPDNMDALIQGFKMVLRKVEVKSQPAETEQQKQADAEKTVIEVLGNYESENGNKKGMPLAELEQETERSWIELLSVLNSLGKKQLIEIHKGEGYVPYWLPVELDESPQLRGINANVWRFRLTSAGYELLKRETAQKPAATEQNAAPAKPERESWWWKLYEKTVKAFFDSLLGKS